MRPSEVTEMTAYIAAVKPSHKFDDIAAKAWAHVLAPIRVEDARVVIDDLLRSKDWIGPNDVVDAVKRLRRDRLERCGVELLAPNIAPSIEEGGRTVENPAYRAEKLALRDAVAAGAWGVPELEAYQRGELPTLTGAPPAVVSGELTSRRMPPLEGVTRRAG